MEKKDLNRINHILDAAKAILKHIRNKQQSDLEKNRLLLGGVIRELMLIGEAANALSPQIKAKIPSVPWKEVIGMRNQLIHGYFELDFVHFLDPSSERCFIQLNKFLGRGKNTPSCEIYYAVFCLSREYGSKKCTKSS
jgi:uncharacterized protein with HEPN domain